VQNTLFDSKLLIRPNPVSAGGQIVINLDFSEDMIFQIIDTQGKILKTISTLGQKGENLLDFEAQSLPAGIYRLNARGATNQPFNCTFSVVH
jgi:hypothetical protein